MISRLLKVLSLAALLSALVMTYPLLAAPPTPFNPWGTVKINGEDVLSGTLVSAWCAGVKYGHFAAELYEGESWYNMDVLGDDLDTLEKDGCSVGEQVDFKIGDVNAYQTATWQSGQQQITFTATASFTPWGTVKVDGENVLTGTLVSAWCGGAKYAESGSTFSGTESLYYLQVSHDNPGTSEIDGCVNDEQVSFKIGDLAAQETTTWKVGPEQVNLTAISASYVYLPLILRSWASE